MSTNQKHTWHPLGEPNKSTCSDCSNNDSNHLIEGTTTQPTWSKVQQFQVDQLLPQELKRTKQVL